MEDLATYIDFLREETSTEFEAVRTEITNTQNNLEQQIINSAAIQDRDGAYINNIAFNTSLSVAEVKSLLDQLSFPVFDEVMLYPIAVTEDSSSCLMVMKYDLGTSVEYLITG